MKYIPREREIEAEQCDDGYIVAGEVINHRAFEALFTPVTCGERVRGELGPKRCGAVASVIFRPKGDNLGKQYRCADCAARNWADATGWEREELTP